ncbi:proton-coupled folate transporter-like [Branchiostoma lanceolatum]|uniref:proton-coupled folate transporter-like n=1 Tax=Branchiostoma lanceolatum TaxID=7740 RepID=UPI0034511C06
MVLLVRHSFKTRQWKLGAILFAFFLSCGVYATAPGIITLTVIGPPFCWTPDLLGYFYVATCAGFIIGVVGIKILGKCLSSYGLMQVSFLSGGAAMVIQALAIYAPNRNAAFFSAAAAGCLQTVSSPVMKAVMSKMVPQTQQGSLFALSVTCNCCLSRYRQPVCPECYL